MENLAFSWNKGVSVSGLTITNQDQSPFLALECLQLIPEWHALLGKKLKISSLIIEGITLTVERDSSGQLRVGSFSDISSPISSGDSQSQPSALKGKAPNRDNSLISQGLSALFIKAHITGGDFTFIDRRLDTTTQIKDFSADINMQSLKNPINFFLKGMLVLNDTPPEPLELKGAALFSSSGKIDLSKAKGTISMEAGFGQMKGFFDANTFNADIPVTGGHLSCAFDLNKLSKVLAGILGFPPGFSWGGKLTSSLDARGNFQSQIAVNGVTQLTDLSITSGPFQRAPFEQPKIDFSQEVLINLNTQKIEIKAFSLASDFLKLFLSGTINNFQKDPYSNLTLSGTGDLREMAYLLRNFFHLSPALNLSGITRLSLSGTGAAKNFHLKGATVVRGLSVEHPALKGRPFQEKTLRISPDLLYNLKKHRVTITSLLIRGKSLAGEIKGTVDEQSDIDLEGTLSLKFAELKKQLLDALPRVLPSGGESSSAFTIKGNFKNSIVVKGDHDLPLLSKLKVTHDLIYSPGQDTFAFTTLTAKSPCLNFNGQGTVTQISKNPFATFEGKLALVLEEIQKSWKDSLPKKMILQGAGSLTFTAEGKLKSAENKPVLSSWIGNSTVFLDTMSYQDLGTIQNLKSTECTLDKGVLAVTLEGLLNNGPVKVQGTIDFNQRRPVMKLNGEGKDIAVSRDQKILGYVVPISSNSTQFTGKGDFSLEATWHGTHWEPEISRSITGKGVVNLYEGTLQSRDSLSTILKFLGKPDTIQFDQIVSPFSLGEGKIYDNTIQVTGEDIQLKLQGWTSLVYDPEKKGNPIEYRVTGDSLRQSLGKDAQKILPFLSGEDATIPVVITGTVQKPKVSVKFPKAKKIFKDFFKPSNTKLHSKVDRGGNDKNVKKKT